MNEDLIKEIELFIEKSSIEIKEIERLINNYNATILARSKSYENTRKKLIKKYFKDWGMLFITEGLMLIPTLGSAIVQGSIGLPFIVFFPYLGAEIGLFIPTIKRIKRAKERILLENSLNESNLVELRTKLEKLKKETITKLKSYRQSLLQYRESFNLYESKNDELLNQIENMLISLGESTPVTSPVTLGLRRN